jgi:hypothetical protein
MLRTKEHLDDQFVKGSKYKCQNDDKQVFLYDGESLQQYSADQVSSNLVGAIPIACPPTKKIITSKDDTPTFGPTPSLSCKVESFTPF